jgi:outer membrane receptor protein involved in Fe transport
VSRCPTVTTAAGSSINPVRSLQTEEKNANSRDTVLIRLSGLWAPSDNWTVAPSIYYQDQKRNDIDNYWPLYSDPAAGKFVNANPSQRKVPDKFYIAALKVQADLSFAQFISNTSYFHRQEQTGYEGTLYNLGFYQVYAFPGNTLLDGTGVHLPAGVTDYRSPSSIDNHQENITQELRLQSNDSASRLLWTGGVFLSVNGQSYLEQIHDPMLNELSLALAGVPYTDIFTYTDANGNTVRPSTRIPGQRLLPEDHAKDEQYAIRPEVLLQHLKATLGARFSKNKYSFETLTGGPQLYAATSTGSGDNSENSFTPKASLQLQADANNMYYFTYAKGFRPGGANNPLPQAACSQDFVNFGITEAPTTYSSDTVNSYELGAKNNGWLGIGACTTSSGTTSSKRSSAHLPNLVHRQSRSSGGRGADLQADIAGITSLSAGRRLHGCALHGRFAPEYRRAVGRWSPTAMRHRGLSGPARPADRAVTAPSWNTASACCALQLITAMSVQRDRAKWLSPAGQPVRCGTTRRILCCRARSCAPAAELGAPGR